ncbi:MAG: LuxR C-terminal-related transcriptional regulator [Chloroflexi bacterium]|nr:LuxR C-terminal-related transcriptional regulator [Chloroflexota bacterium]
MPSVLLQTKLRHPSLPPKRVRRPQLIARLAEGFESGRQITLVSGPAGFGKTTCVTEWLQGLNQPVSWLSLDPSDNDPARFFSYFIAALQKADQNVGKEIGLALNSVQLPPVETISAGLVNDLLQVASPFLLVLDDLHVIQNSTVLDVLEKLATNPPPCLFLVLLTREDPSLPLARLRANNQVTEIRAADLRFTLDEANAFLNEVMDLALSREETASLSDRTEGWVVGLQLAALSLKNRENRGEFIARLSGSQHFILSYLTEEVLRRQQPDIQDYILCTSVLDRLSGPLCNAVAERADSAAILAHLYSSNVFVIPLDEEHTWYRYHHLFADLLRGQLNRTEPARVPELHRRASEWYEQQGMAAEAVEHAFAALDYARAVPLLEQHARPMLMQGYAQTVEDWLHRLPAEWRVAGPRANLALAGSLILRGLTSPAKAYLHDAEAAAEECTRSGALDEANAIMAEALALRAFVVSLEGETERACERARTAVDRAPKQDVYLQGMTRFALAATNHQAGHGVKALEIYRDALPLCQAAGFTAGAMLIVGSLTLLYQLTGQLHAAADLSRHVIAQTEDPPGAASPALATVYSTLASIEYEWGNVVAAQTLVDKCLATTKRGGHVSALAHGHLLDSRLHQVTGDLSGAQQAIERARELLRFPVANWVPPRAAIQQVSLALASDDVVAAQQALAQTGVTLDEPLWDGNELVYIGYLRLFSYLSRREPEVDHLQRGLELATQLVESAERTGRKGRLIEILALRALLFASAGDLSRATDDLERSLTMAEGEGFLRLYVDEGEPMLRLLRAALARGIRPAYVSRILAAFPEAAKSTPPSPSDLVEPLTEQELAVLRLLSQNLTYRQIAGQMVISLNTVRFHVKAIYGKLCVDKRAAAIDRARVLGLLI